MRRDAHHFSAFFRICGGLIVKIIVGLGNPGKKYENTRHNAGFWVVDCLAKRWGINLNSRKFRSIVAEHHYAGVKAVLAKPQTYMNLSGAAVQQMANYWQVNPEDILVIHDDLDLDPYRIRLRSKGSSGGHRGVSNIINQLGTEAFPRLKMGIGKPLGQIPIEAYVLAQIPAPEQKEWLTVIEKSADAAEVWLKSGIEQAMNQYNNSI